MGSPGATRQASRNRLGGDGVRVVWRAAIGRRYTLNRWRAASVECVHDRRKSGGWIVAKKQMSTGKLAAGGIQGETRQALENIKHVLETNGSSMDDVVKCTAMLADIKEWAAMNEVYVTFFPNHLPARSAFATNGLVLGGRVEIECIATRSRTK